MHAQLCGFEQVEVSMYFSMLTKNSFFLIGHPENYSFTVSLFFFFFDQFNCKKTMTFSEEGAALYHKALAVFAIECFLHMTKLENALALQCAEQLRKTLLAPR